MMWLHRVKKGNTRAPYDISHDSLRFLQCYMDVFSFTLEQFLRILEKPFHSVCLADNVVIWLYDLGIFFFNSYTKSLLYNWGKFYRSHHFNHFWWNKTVQQMRNGTLKCVPFVFLVAMILHPFLSCRWPTLCSNVNTKRHYKHRVNSN